MIRKLIDYSTKMPKSSDFDTGFKFPYFACEILSSESEAILDRFLSKTEIEIESPDDEEDYNDSNESEEDDEDEEEENNEYEGSDREKNSRKIDDDNEYNDNEQNEDNDEFKEEQLTEETNVIKEEDKAKETEEKEKQNDIKEDENIDDDSKQEEQELNEDNKQKEDDKPISIEEVIIKIQIGKTTEDTIESPKNQEKEVSKTDKKIEDPNGENGNEKPTEKEDKQSEDEETNLDNSEKEVTKNKKKRKKRERKYQTVYTNLDHFFEFLEIPPNESNYVLIGYFNKILCSLIDKRGDIIINYLFDLKTEILDSLIKHLNRRLIGESICRILSYSNDSSLPSLNEKKLQLLEKIIQELNETNDDDSYEFICNSLINAISNRQLFQLLLSKKDLLDLLFSILFSNQKRERNLQSLLTLMIKINETIIKALNGLNSPDKTTEGIMEQFNNYFDNNMNSFEERKYLLGNTEEENEKNLQMTLKHIFDILKDSNLLYFEDLNKFNNSDFDFITSYDGKQKVLGLYKLHQVEFFKTILDIIVNAHSKKYHESDIEVIVKMIKDSFIFKHLIELFFSFEFNNIYQNTFGQIMTLILNQHCPSELISHVFKEENIIDKMQNHLINNWVFSFSSNRIINSCLFAFEVNFLSEVYFSSNVHIEEIVNANEEFKKFEEIYLKDLYGLFKGKLCYTEEENAFSDQSPNIIKEKVIYQPLNENIKNNIDIYNVYKSGGDYQSLIDEKINTLNRMRKESENEAIDVNIFDKKSNDDYIGDNVFDNPNENDMNVFDVIQPTLDENNYYDNNYWNIIEGKNNDALNDLLNDLFQ